MNAKRIISSLLICFTLTSIIWKTVSVIHFYINQDAIAEEHCVNKEKPELNCHGQCHLQEVLTVDTPSPEEQSPAYQNTIPIFLFGFMSPMGIKNTVDSEEQQPVSSLCLDSISEQDMAGIDRPPEQLS